MARLLALPLSIPLLFASASAFAQPTTDPCPATESSVESVATVVGEAAALVGGPQIANDETSLGKHIVAGMDEANRWHGPSDGIHYAHNYKRNNPDLWKDDYWRGLTDETYFERQGFMTWRLKPGVSASEAIKKWLAGLTIAECLTTVQALQTDALRAAVGDKRFDELFGSKDGDPEHGRLTIGPGYSTVRRFMVPTDAAKNDEVGAIGRRPAKVGEHYYFYNHPKYLLKHPGGAWQGENALYVGERDGVQIWTGLGASNVTEDEMMEQMIRAYNAPRTDRDREVLREHYGEDESKWPAEYKEGSGSFPDQIEVKDILDAPEHTIDWTTRKGGFVGSAGLKLDTEAIERLKKKER